MPIVAIYCFYILLWRNLSIPRPRRNCKKIMKFSAKPSRRRFPAHSLIPRRPRIFPPTRANESPLPLPLPAVLPRGGDARTISLSLIPNLQSRPRGTRGRQKIFSKKLAYTPERAKILCYHYIVKRRVNAKKRACAKKRSPLQRARLPQGRRQRAAQRGALNAENFLYRHLFARIYGEISSRKLIGRNPSLHEIIAECASFIQSS